MRDLSHPSLMYVKAALFPVIGVIAGALLIARDARLSTMLLLVICVWAFARAYYFAFYVIERYIDPAFRFSGLWSAVRFLTKRGSAPASRATHAPP